MKPQAVIAELCQVNSHSWGASREGPGAWKWISREGRLAVLDQRTSLRKKYKAGLGGCAGELSGGTSRCCGPRVLPPRKAVHVGGNVCLRTLM